MLAEKFFLVLETPCAATPREDGALRIVKNMFFPHITIDLSATRSDHDRRDRSHCRSLQATS